MIKKHLFKFIAILLSALMLIPLWGCGSKSNSSAPLTQLDKIKKAGVLVVGTSADYPPYEFHAQVNGQDQISGFDIDIANQIAKDLGVKLQLKDMSFDGLLAALETGNVDMVIAGMNPSPERAKKVDFSEVYYTAVQAVLVRQDEKDSIKTAADLKGKTVGVQKGTVQEQVAHDKLKDSNIKALAKVPDLILQLKNKDIDALIIELPVGSAYVGKNNDLAISDVTFQTDETGSAIAVQKNSPELLAAVNKTLDNLKKNDSISKFFANASDLMNK